MFETKMARWLSLSRDLRKKTLSPNEKKNELLLSGPRGL
jgi:hypothetical protein